MSPRPTSVSWGRFSVAAIASVTLIIAPAVSAAGAAGAAARPELYRQHQAVAAQRARQATTTHSLDAGGDEDGEDPEEIAEGAEQYAEARSAPGVIAPGAYSAAWAQQQALPKTSGRWSEVTDLPYNSDDPRYRDIESNSSGGAGPVTGRITGMAADDSGDVYAGAANGGVWRSVTGGGHWQPIAERVSSPSTGDLRLDRFGRLWWATGEANTSATSFVGTGVYVLRDPRHGAFRPSDRVGGTELESTIIRKVRFIGDTVWAATNRGAYSHSLTTLSGPWKLQFAPNPDYLPGGALQADANAPYKNIINDFAADPTDPSRVIIAAGWRGGDTYNGFYVRSGGAWQRVTLAGDIASDAANVGLVTFASSADGSRYYAIEQSPTQLNTNPDSALQGIYVSRSGSPFGPWTLGADYHELAASGSALTDPGYMPGIQGWYNQFLQVDPSDPDHVWAGLEEVFESYDAASTWTTPGPYWNFAFSCWSIDPSKQTGDCHQTTHADQHSVAVGRFHGQSYVVVGDDGGAYRRPVRGSLDALGHATDWRSLNDGTMDVLQYYSVGVGADRGGVDVTGGLQDNGQSILRPGDHVMGSNFGGDGTDTLVDPQQGCNIAQEYVYLAIWVTNNCAVNNGAWVDDPALATSREVAPPDTVTSAARFVAPITMDPRDPRVWIAGGQHIWVQRSGFAIQSGAEWTSLHDLGVGRVATAVATVGGLVYAGWCGPCNNQGFSRGIAVGNTDGTGWHDLILPADGLLPNRYVSGFDVDQANPQHVVVAINGFSRKWTEGPGAGIGHVFESYDAGAHWTDISGNLPDVPANTVKMIAGGGLALGTDTGIFYRGRGANWSVLGRNLPTTTTMQLKMDPTGRVLYAATHGRGIWSFDLAALRRR